MRFVAARYSCSVGVGPSVDGSRGDCPLSGSAELPQPATPTASAAISGTAAGLTGNLEPGIGLRLPLGGGCSPGGLGLDDHPRPLAGGTLDDQRAADRLDAI